MKPFNIVRPQFMNSTDSAVLRHPELLSKARSRLLIVDVQERLTPHIPRAAETIANCVKLVRGAEILDVPAVATEQYPKGLGATVPELAMLFPERLEKQRFSCAEVLNWGTGAEREDDRDQIIVAGIESHVCVLQTAFDLLAAGFQVFVPADAVASRRELDWKFALRRISDAGAIVTTTESVLFEWAETSATPEFKQISRLIKQSSASGSMSSGDAVEF